MKKAIFAITLLAGLSTQAASVPAFKCTVPSKTGTSTVSLSISVTDTGSADYVLLELNDKAAINLSMQLERGSFKKQIDEGGIAMLVLGDQFTHGDDGVVRGGGLLGLGLNASGKWAGMLAVNSNVYPLDCTKL